MISIGIDVSKGKSTVCFMKPGGMVLKTTFEINHTAKELEDLVAIIKSFNEEVRVVLEDTGHYHLPVVTLLVENGIFICCVNALRMKKFACLFRMLTAWHYLTPSMPLQYTVHLSVTNVVSYFFTVCVLNFINIQHLPLLCPMSELLKELGFFLIAHVSMISTVVAFSHRLQPFLKILLD